MKLIQAACNLVAWRKPMFNVKDQQSKTYSASGEILKVQFLLTQKNRPITLTELSEEVQFDFTSNC